MITHKISTEEVISRAVKTWFWEFDGVEYRRAGEDELAHLSSELSEVRLAPRPGCEPTFYFAGASLATRPWARMHVNFLVAEYDDDERSRICLAACLQYVVFDDYAAEFERQSGMRSVFLRWQPLVDRTTVSLTLSVFFAYHDFKPDVDRFIAAAALTDLIMTSRRQPP